MADLTHGEYSLSQTHQLTLLSPPHETHFIVPFCANISILFMSTPLMKSCKI